MRCDLTREEHPKRERLLLLLLVSRTKGRADFLIHVMLHPPAKWDSSLMSDHDQGRSHPPFHPFSQPGIMILTAALFKRQLKENYSTLIFASWHGRHRLFTAVIRRMRKWLRPVILILMIQEVKMPETFCWWQERDKGHRQSDSRTLDEQQGSGSLENRPSRCLWTTPPEDSCVHEPDAVQMSRWESLSYDLWVSYKQLSRHPRPLSIRPPFPSALPWTPTWKPMMNMTILRRKSLSLSLSLLLMKENDKT